MTNFFSPLSFLAVFGSGSEILDPGWVKSGSGIRDKHPGSPTLLAGVARPTSCRLVAQRKMIRVVPRYLNFFLLILSKTILRYGYST